MDARNLPLAVLLVCGVVTNLFGQNFQPGGYPNEPYPIFAQQAPPQMAIFSNQPVGQSFGGGRQVAVEQTRNFVVSAMDAQLALDVANAAEQLRHDLAIEWLGEPLQDWPTPCPISVQSGANMGAGGRTTFTLQNGGVGAWRMSMQGTPDRILDSVLPHEVTHTIFASHFAPLGKPVPRWADEGSSTTVEFIGERQKHDKFLVKFLSSGQGIPFADMFMMEQYPDDPMPLYAQGYSVTSFLIAQGGRRKFVQFLERGMQTEDWVAALNDTYGYPRVGKLQTAWNNWVADGGGDVLAYTPQALGYSNDVSGLAANDSFSDNDRLDNGVQPASALVADNGSAYQPGSTRNSDARVTSTSSQNAFGPADSVYARQAGQAILNDPPSMGLYDRSATTQAANNFQEGQWGSRQSLGQPQSQSMASTPGRINTSQPSDLPRYQVSSAATRGTQAETYNAARQQPMQGVGSQPLLYSENPNARSIR